MNHFNFLKCSEIFFQNYKIGCVCECVCGEGEEGGCCYIMLLSVKKLLKMQIDHPTSGLTPLADDSRTNFVASLRCFCRSSSLYSLVTFAK